MHQFFILCSILARLASKSKCGRIPSARQPCENSLRMRLHACEHGVLRLRDCCAMCSSCFAQDDRVLVAVEMGGTTIKQQVPLRLRRFGMTSPNFMNEETAAAREAGLFSRLLGDDFQIQLFGAAEDGDGASRVHLGV